MTDATQRGPQPAPGTTDGGGLRRFRATIAYDGTRYHGWAAQPGLLTVEASLREALGHILRTPEVAVACAGRTDAGVHARGQVIHFDSSTAVTPGRLRNGFNAVLPPDIRMLDLDHAPPGFDARFSALWRRYRYTVADGAPDPLLRHRVVSVRRPLDCGAMDRAVAGLVGEHDFLSFCKPRPGASTVRRILVASWTRAPDGTAVLDISADAFCHSLVRSVVGVSLEIGSGRRPVAWARELLRAPSRSSAAPVAPPHGLVLEQVGYPSDEQLGEQAQRARRFRG